MGQPQLVFHFPHYNFDVKGPASAILLGGHKLIRFYEPDERLLFDLTSDPSERRNLAADMPAKTAQLEDRLGAYLESVNAGMPVANLDYDPNKPVSEARRGGGRRRQVRNRQRR